jgi:hypothetical protein
MRTNTLSKAGASLDMVWNLSFFRFFQGFGRPSKNELQSHRMERGKT